MDKLRKLINEYLATLSVSEDDECELYGTPRDLATSPLEDFMDWLKSHEEVGDAEVDHGFPF